MEHVTNVKDGVAATYVALPDVDGERANSLAFEGSADGSRELKADEVRWRLI